MTRAERRKLTVLWLLSVVFSAGTAAVCALSWHVHSRHHEPRGSVITDPDTAAEERLFQWLLEGGALPDLTAAQRVEVEKLRAALRVEAAARLPEARAARQDIAALLRAGEAPDSPALAAARERLARNLTDRQRDLLACCFHLRDILNRAQREVFFRHVETTLLYRHFPENDHALQR